MKPNEHQSAIIASYHETKSMKQTGALFGISRQRVQQILKQFEVESFQRHSVFNRDQIIDLIEKGYGKMQICKLLECCNKRLDHFCEKENISFPETGIPNKMIAEWIMHYCSNKSLNWISKKYNSNIKTIAKYLRMNGIRIRGKYESLVLYFE